MGGAATEVLRRLNERLDYTVDWPVYGPRITHQLAPGTLARRASDRPLRLPPQERGWVAEWAEAAVAQVRGLGCRVAGDLADLEVPRGDEPEATSGGPSAEDLLDVALEALAALVCSSAPTSTGA